MLTKLLDVNLIDGVKQKVNIFGPKVIHVNEQFLTKRNKTFDKKRKLKIVIESQTSDLSSSQFCEKEGISLQTLNLWIDQYLVETEEKESSFNSRENLERTKDFKNSVVLEGKSGANSVAEICRREGISHETFIVWSEEFLSLRRETLFIEKEKNSNFLKNKLLFSKVSSIEVFNYINNYLDFSLKDLSIHLNSSSLRLKKLELVQNIVVMQKINDIRYINKFFESINMKMKNGGVFVGCMETFSARRDTMPINRIPIISSVYFSLEFLIKRIIPKISFTKKYYFDLTKGNDRLMSKAEGLGRLVSCGFKIMDYESIDGVLYFVVKKVKEPSFDMSPSYGPIYKMPRLGKDGRTIGVYKFRTMHPYSEYLQDYIVRANGYAETGKPANDFRTPNWGKFMRRYWLDELPQLINVLKGELNLVGIRPVSERYFQDIPKEMQKLRLTQKPGCIPPYVSLNRAGNVMSVLQAEKDYLEEKIKHPHSTNFKYFCSAIFNIIFKNKRSA